MSRTSTTKSPGAILKEARQALDLSLSDVAAMTRISRTMLAHLEADRYDEYSADVFARGHLRSYARELKLDPEVVVQAYDRHTGRRSGRFESAAEGGSPLDSADEQGSIDGRFSRVAGRIRASHIVAVGLFVVFLFFVFQLFSDSPATARDANEYPSESDREVEEEADEARWLVGESGDDDGGGESDRDD